METLRYLMDLMNANGRFNKILNAYDRNNIEDVMKCLIRCCKIYEGIEHLGTIFLCHKNIEEIQNFCSDENNLINLNDCREKIDEQRNNIEQEMQQKIDIIPSKFILIPRYSI